MIEIGLIITAIVTAIAGYRVVKRAKRIEELNLRVQSMTINIL